MTTPNDAVYNWLRTYASRYLDTDVPVEDLARIADMAVAGLRDAGLLNRGETTPRTFALPEMPADVVAVKDRGGRTWRRYEPGDDFWVNDGSIVGHSSIQLIATRGPLTEVVDSS